MSRVIVTGGAGFIGQHTIKLLDGAGYEVINCDNKISKKFDIRNIDNLRHLFKPGDKILHLAAVSRFAEAENNPVEAFATTVGGTLNVIRAANEKRCDRVVHASTGSVYMPVWKVPIREDHPIEKGNSVYGMTKIMAERMFMYECKVPWVILRYGHLYGEGKTWGGIGSFIERMSRGMKPILYGGYQSNDFCYVKDIAYANLLALETQNINEAYNISGGEELKIGYVFNKIQEALKRKVSFDTKQLRTVDAIRFVCDISKAKRLLEWTPQYNIEEGLKEMFKNLNI